MRTEILEITKEILESRIEDFDVKAWHARVLANSWPENQLERWTGTGMWRWEELDVNCLSRIFARLTLGDKVLSLPFVCKSWYRASLDPLCWRSLDFVSPTIWWQFETFEAMFRRQYPGREPSLSGLLKLALHRSQGATAELYLPPLGDIISEYGGDDISREDLELVKQECPGIKLFSYPPLGCDLEESILYMVENWKNLETIHMGGYMYYFNETLAAIQKHCPRFRCLMISGTLEYNLHEKETNAIVALARLKKLVLLHSLVDTNCLMSLLDRCKELEELHLWCCRDFSLDDVKNRADAIWTLVYHIPPHVMSFVRTEQSSCSKKS